MSHAVFSKTLVWSDVAIIQNGEIQIRKITSAPNAEKVTERTGMAMIRPISMRPRVERNFILSTPHKTERNE